MVVHAGLASMSKIPELVLTPDEATPLATAIAAAMEEFDIPVDRKTQVIVGLIAVAGSVYAPRVYLYNERMKKEKRAKKQAGNATVVTIDGQVFDEFSAGFPPQ